ncbi:MAG: hypothetical protein IJ745_07485, partial [Bacteroidales bacterium]|nr:hypothetical protein [Bacteroidales bacterium]
MFAILIRIFFILKTRWRGFYCVAPGENRDLGLHAILHRRPGLLRPGRSRFFLRSGGFEDAEIDRRRRHTLPVHRETPQVHRAAAPALRQLHLRPAAAPRRPAAQHTLP